MKAKTKGFLIAAGVLAAVYAASVVMIGVIAATAIFVVSVGMVGAFVVADYYYRKGKSGENVDPGNTVVNSFIRGVDDL